MAGVWAALAELSGKAMVYFEGKTAEGDDGIGSGFHIGGGWLLTASHVVTDLREFRIWQDDSATVSIDLVPVEFDEVLRDGEHDLALVRSGFAGPALEVLRPDDVPPVPQDDILVLGFPPVAGLTSPQLMSDRGYITAIPRRRDSNGSFPIIISTTVQPGMSGGPVILEHGRACGVVSIGRVREIRSGRYEYNSSVSYRHIWDLLLDTWAGEAGEHAEWVREAVGRGIRDHDSLLPVELGR